MLSAGPLLHAFRYDEAHVREWHPATLGEMRAQVDGKANLWINVNGTQDAEALASLERDFGLHPLTVEDIRHTHQRPKVEEYPNYLYVVSQMIKENKEGDFETEQVSMLLGEGWLITIQEGKPGDVFESIRERIRQGRPQIRGGGLDYLAYALQDAIVDAYFPRLERFSAQAEELEEQILSGSAEDARAKLQWLRRDLLTLRRVAWPQRDALAQLERGEARWIKPATRTFLRDVVDHATRVIDFVETNRELIASLMDLHVANVTQRTNDVMKVLTIVATIFIPLTFVASLYGMNFEFIPFLHAQWGFWVSLGIMAAIGLTMFAWFRRNGWV